MSNLTRKDFLRLSSWGLLATLVPVAKLNALSFILENNSSSKEDYEKAKELAKQAKVFFYKKNFQKAEELYLQCIKLAPQSIRFYDGLDNVYGAKSDLLSSVELYKNGLLANPKILAFYDRSARSLMRLELGNRKKAIKYREKINSISLLNDAQKLFNTALAIDSSKKYLSVGLQKINKKIERQKIGDQTVLFKTSKDEKKTNRKQFLKGFQIKTEPEIKALLEKVDSKKRPTLYHVKEIEHQKRQIIKQKIRYFQLLLSKTNPDDSNRIVIIEQIFRLNPSNSYSLFQMKQAYYKNKRYADFISIREQFVQKKETFFSKLGLMDAIEKAYIENQIVFNDLEKAVAIGKDIFNNWSLLEDKRVDVANKLSKIYLLQRQYNEAKLVLEQTIKMVSTTQPSVVNKLIYSYANVLFLEKNYEKAKQILQIGLRETIDKTEDYNDIQAIAKGKKTETMKDMISLYYLLYKIYNASNQNEKANEILDKLYQFNPKDQFVLTRKNG